MFRRCAFQIGEKLVDARTPPDPGNLPIKLFDLPLLHKRCKIQEFARNEAPNNVLAHGGTDATLAPKEQGQPGPSTKMRRKDATLCRATAY